MSDIAPSMVIKVGGRVQSDGRLAPALAALWTAWCERAPARDAAGRARVFCVVHGGGEMVSALQRAAGVEPAFVGGRRVTAPEDIDRLRMALSGVANKRLVAALGGAGVHAVGLSGEDGPLLLADPLEGGALGAVGAVRHVDAALLSLLVGAGYLPVIAPVAATHAAVGGDSSPATAVAAIVGDGGPVPSGGGLAARAALNVNGDDAAAAIAAAVGARELLLVSDVAGVRVGGQLVSELTAPMAARAIAAGEITGGMEAKVQAALAALGRGVGRVRIGGLAMVAGRDAGTAVIEDTAAHRLHAPAHAEEVAA